MLAGEGEQDPRMCFERQKAETQRQMRMANEELCRLIESHPNVPSKPCDMEDATAAELKKCIFMKSQMDAATAMVQGIIAQVAAWETNTFFEEPNPANTVQQNRFFQEATQLMWTVEYSFRHAMSIETSLFGGAVFEEFKSVLERHSKKVKGTVVGGAVIGGLLGGGAHGLVWPHGIVHLGLHSLLAANFGEVGAVVVGAAGGAVVGIILVIVGASIVWAVDKCCRKAPNQEDEEDQKQQREMAKRIKEISEKSFDTESILQLKELFESLFVQPMAPAVNGESCAICLEHFPADGGRVQERPMKAPRCQGNHLVCVKCNRTWLRTRYDDSCVICRQ